MSLQIKISIDKLGNPTITASGESCETRSAAINQMASALSSETIVITSNPNEIDSCHDQNIELSQ